MAWPDDCSQHSLPAQAALSSSSLGLILAWECSKVPTTFLSPRIRAQPLERGLASCHALSVSAAAGGLAAAWAKGLSSIFTSQPRFSPLMVSISSAELLGSKAAWATQQFIKFWLPQGTGQRINMCIGGQARPGPGGQPTTGVPGSALNRDYVGGKDVRCAGCARLTFS